MARWIFKKSGRYKQPDFFINITYVCLLQKNMVEIVAHNLVKQLSKRFTTTNQSGYNGKQQDCKQLEVSVLDSSQQSKEVCFSGKIKIDAGMDDVNGQCPSSQHSEGKVPSGNHTHNAETHYYRKSKARKTK